MSKEQLRRAIKAAVVVFLMVWIIIWAGTGSVLVPLIPLSVCVAIVYGCAFITHWVATGRFTWRAWRIFTVDDRDL